MSGQLPSDAIEVQDAIKKYGHTWTWYKGHVTIYYTGIPRKGYASEAEVQREHDKAQQVDIRRPGEG